MRLTTVLRIALLAAFVASPQAASANRAKAKVTQKKASPKARAKVATRTPTPRKGIGLRSRLANKLFARRARKSAKPESRKALESRLAHRFSPFSQGMSRTWSVTLNGKPHTTMTETVAKTQVMGKNEIHSEVHTKNSAGGFSTAVHVTYKGELIAPQTAKLGDAAPKGVSHYGPAMPAKLKVGKTWDHIVQQEGSSRGTAYKVTKAIKMTGPDGKMRNGFEISMVDRSRVYADGKKVAETKSTGTMRVLEGVGMVYARNTTNGSTMTHVLTEFSAP